MVEVISILKQLYEEQPKQCAVCGSTQGLHSHHIYGGNPGRKLSEKYYMKMWLCPFCHNLGGPKCIHQNRELDLHYKREYQARFENVLMMYGGHDMESARQEFINTFGRNYIGVD